MVHGRLIEDFEATVSEDYKPKPVMVWNPSTKQSEPVKKGD